MIRPIRGKGPSRNASRHGLVWAIDISVFSFQLPVNTLVFTEIAQRQIRAHVIPVGVERRVKRVSEVPSIRACVFPFTLSVNNGSLFRLHVQSIRGRVQTGLQSNIFPFYLRVVLKTCFVLCSARMERPAIQNLDDVSADPVSVEINARKFANR